MEMNEAILEEMVNLRKQIAFSAGEIVGAIEEIEGQLSDVKGELAIIKEVLDDRLG